MKTRRKDGLISSRCTKFIRTEGIRILMSATILLNELQQIEKAYLIPMQKEKAEPAAFYCMCIS